MTTVALPSRLCECGCGNDLGDSPSMFFKWDICQSLWMLSQPHPDPQEWRERQREMLIFVSLSPIWHPQKVIGELGNWEMHLRYNYAWVVWADLNPGQGECPEDWLPTVEQAMPYVIRDWYVTCGPGTPTSRTYGNRLFKPKFFTRVKV